MTRAMTVLAAVACWPAAAAAQHDHPHGDPPPPLTLEVGSARAGPGAEVEVAVTAKGAAGLGPMQMVLTYDPAVLEPLGAERGPVLGGNTLLEHAADPSGRLAVAWATQQPIGGDGVLLKAKFRVVGAQGQKCTLGLDSVRAWDAKTHLDALVTVKPGEFVVDAGEAGGVRDRLWLWVGLGVGAVLVLAVVAWKAARRSRVANG
jgi:hypothetical protein